jgi:hypothetical protein
LGPNQADLLPVNTPVVSGPVEDRTNLATSELQPHRLPPVATAQRIRPRRDATRRNLAWDHPVDARARSTTAHWADPEGAHLATGSPKEAGTAKNPLTSQVQLRLAKADKEELPKPDKFPPITLHLDDVDVRKALELLSRQGSMNILVSPGVSGRITANFQGLRLDRAVEAIVRQSNLVAHREDGLLFVCTPDEFERLKAAKRKLESRIYRLSYMRAADLAVMITPFLSKDVGRMATTPESDVV